MAYQVVTNIPAPSTAVDITPYPFSSMTVGSSFHVPFPTVDAQGKSITYSTAQKQALQQTIARAARYHAGTTDPRRSYITQVVTTPTPGVRCWRTDDIVVPNTTTA